MRDVIRSSNSSGRESSQDRVSFAVALMELKRQGCCVLVTGRVNERTRAAQSSHLFGNNDASRHRVLALTDATASGLDWYLPDGISQAHSSVTVLDHTETVRDAAGTVDPSLQHSDVDDGSPTIEGGLGTMLRESIEATVRNGPTGPSVFRLGVATLGALIAIDGLSSTRAFVGAVRTGVVEVHGMVHFHLPGVPDPETFEALYPEIDIHIELRDSHHVPEHRWHLLEAGLSTDWLPVQS